MKQGGDGFCGRVRAMANLLYGGGTPRTSTAARRALSIGYHGFRDAAFPGSRCRINGLVSDLRHWSSLRVRRYEQRRSLSPSGRSFWQFSDPINKEEACFLVS